MQIKKSTSWILLVAFLFLSMNSFSQVQYADTSNMLLPYLRKTDTTNMLSRYLRRTDTSFMLIPYLRKTDTSLMLSRYLRRTDTSFMLSRYLRRTDTSFMLSRYLRRTDTASMLLPYLRKIDTASMLTRYLRRSDTSTLVGPYLRKTDTSQMLNGYIRTGNLPNIAGKMNYTDTLNMLLGYLRKGDTSQMLNGYLRSGNLPNIAGKMNYTDTLNMLLGYLRKGDTSQMLSGYLRSGNLPNIAGKMNYTDTLNMLLGYLRKGDTSQMLNGYLRSGNLPNIAGKMNYTDTLNMLLGYLRKGDTSQMLSGYLRSGNLPNIAGKMNYTDTLNMLLGYLRKGDTSQMLSGYLRSGNLPNISGKMNYSDTLSLLMNYLRKGDTTQMLSGYARIGNIPLANSKVNFSDTLAMLLPYLRKTDTTSMLSRYLLRSDTTSLVLPYVRKSDTTFMLSRYLRRSDTASLVLPYLRRSDTTFMLSRYLRRSDTASLVLPYLRRSDTTFMLSRYLRRTDTAFMLSPYLRKSDTTSVLTRYFQRSDTTSLVAPYLRKGDTSQMLSGYLRIGNLPNISGKINYSDSANMLQNYLRKSDTSNLVSPYLRRSDTANMLKNYVNQSSLAAAIAANTQVPTLQQVLSKSNVSSLSASFGSLSTSSPTLLLNNGADTVASLSFVRSLHGDKITGIGTTGFLPKWTGNSTFGNSQLFDNGTNVGIGTTSPITGNRLQVDGGYVSVRGVLGGGGGFYLSHPNTTNADARTWGFGASISAFGDFGINQSNAKDGDPITAGTSRFYISNTGNVGIGTTSPSERLHLFGNTFRQNDASNSFGYTISTTSATTTLATLFGGSSFGIRTGGSGSDNFHINSTGNVGIGTTSPSAKLDVNGVIKNNNKIYANTNNGNGTAVIGTYFNNTSIAQFSNNLRINHTSEYGFMQGSDGKNYIGGSANFIEYGRTIIGSSADNGIDRLQVNGSGRFVNNLTANAFVKTGGTATQYLMADGSVSSLPSFMGGTGTTNYIPKFTSSTAIGNSQIFDNGTNVGIGTTNNGGDGGVAPRLAIANPSNADKFVGIGFDNTGDYGFIHSIHRATAWKNLALQAFGGNVGIGTTSPAYPFQVRRAGGAGSLGISIDNVVGTDRAVQYFAIQDVAASAGAGHAFYYRAQGSATDVLGFVLDENGRFGIGTVSPAATLAVQGTTLINTNTDNGVDRLQVNGSGLYTGSLTVGTGSGNLLVGTTGTGADGVGLLPSYNYSFSEGSGASYSNFFRQSNSAASVLANGYKYSSSANGFASSTSVPWAKSAIAVGYNTGSISFFSDPITTIPNGTSISPTERMRITADDKVGIGTVNPQANLSIKSGNNVDAEINSLPEGIDIKSFNRTSNAYGYISFKTNAENESMRISNTGQICIGCLVPGNYKMAVEGSMAARSLRITQSPGWADYVFDKKYYLRPLDEVEKFIQQNHHLPDLPSASTVAKEGIDVAEMQSKLLSKIEELTLYVIELKKEVEILKKNKNSKTPPKKK